MVVDDERRCHRRRGRDTRMDDHVKGYEDSICFLPAMSKYESSVTRYSEDWNSVDGYDEDYFRIPPPVPRRRNVVADVCRVFSGWSEALRIGRAGVTPRQQRDSQRGKRSSCESKRG
mmetsp:Transcript_36661/g.146551  ORF Transcript_36661/g.146551 Transcript_36661/m.146551 type:complete len:117 (-) Transcript_36661:1490-1840(-)